MSFRKRNSASISASLSSGPPLPGATRPSPTGGPPITSTGLRPLDAALSGGLPLASLTLLLEDAPTSYHFSFLSYFIAQGLHSHHAVAVVSFHRPAASLLAALPQPAATPHLHTTAPVPPHAPRHAPHMPIAWRYAKAAASPAAVAAVGVPPLPLPLPSFASSHALDFDLSERGPPPPGAALSCLGRGVSTDLAEVLEQLRQHLQRASARNQLTRIAVVGLSPAAAGAPSVVGFLARVRAYTRFYGAVAMVTVGAGMSRREALVVGDAVLEVDSFEGKGGGVAGVGKEWLGVLIVRKVCAGGKGRGDVWVFKRGRRKFVMERATAAPDEEEVAGGGDGGPGSACGAKPGDVGMEF